MAALSETVIINRALSKLGVAQITSRSEASDPARQADSMFDYVRDCEMRDRIWNFTKKRTTLAADVATPSFDYSYQYTLPSDFLRLYQVGQYTWATTRIGSPVSIGALRPYELEGGKILTSLPAPLKIIYIRRVTDVTTWDLSFVEVMACRLALEMAGPLTESSTLKREMADMYQKATIMAVQANALEVYPELMDDGPWLESRLGWS